MGISSRTAYSTQPYYSGWEDIVSITNPEKGCPTCVGFAPSRGRRCWNRIAAHRVAWATKTVLSLRGFDAEISSKLRSVASDMLCHVHGYEREDVVRGWMEKGKVLCDVRYGLNKLDESLERLRRLVAEYEERESSRTATSPAAAAAGEDWQRDRRRTTPQQQFKRESSNGEHTGSGYQQQYKGSYFTSEDWSSRFQQKSKPRQPTRGTESAAPEPPKPQTRSEAWTSYMCKWKCLEAGPQDRDAKIPWPTKSGLLRDVNEANVRQFFLKGPPADLNSVKERYERMSTETKRWHTDKMASRFGSEIIAGEQKEALNMVARVVVELWKEAKIQKNKSQL